MARCAEAPLAQGALFELLAHPERRRLLARLGAGDAPSGVLARATGVSWPQTSRHLGLLEGAQLVSVRRRGRERIYRLERERLKRAAEAWLAELLAEW
jgi:DNA-binding transcriptional ArsR family regulator